MRKPPGMLWLTCLLTAALAPAAARADTVVPGGNVVNQTWTAAGSPYLVQGDVTVPAGAALTIEAGAVVRFEAGDSQRAGVDAMRSEITVNGRLAVNGTAASPVLFQARSGAAARTWYGILLPRTATAATLRHAIIEHAEVGITSAVAGLEVRDTTIRTSYRGMLISDGPSALCGITVTGCGDHAVLVDGTAHIDGATLTNNGQTGIAARGLVEGTVRVENAVIVGNGYGVTVGGAPGKRQTVELMNVTIHGNRASGVFVTSDRGQTVVVRITNSLLTQNMQWGVENFLIDAGNPATIAVTYSDVWDNKNGDYRYAMAGASTLSANPQYAAPPGDLHLRASSVAIDAGVATAATDHDRDLVVRPVDGLGIGARRFDLGAFEFVPAGVDAGLADACFEGDGGGAGGPDGGQGPSDGAQGGPDGGAAAADSGGAGDGAASGGRGCSCRAAPGAAGPGGDALLAGAVLLLLRRRRAGARRGTLPAPRRR